MIIEAEERAHLYNNSIEEEDRDIVELQDYESYKKMKTYNSKLDKLDSSSDSLNKSQKHKEHSFMEELIHQGIETIEFVLGNFLNSIFKLIISKYIYIKLNFECDF